MTVPSSSDPLPPLPDDLAGRLTQAEAALERVHHREELLAYGLSHDLRAPLRAINGYAQLLMGQHAEGLDPQGREYLGRIRDAAGRMEGLIEKLLQLSYVSRAQLRMAQVDLGMLVEWSVAELEDLEPGLKPQLEVQPDLHVQGDERQLKQLFERLLHNAWKFSRASGQVRIQVHGQATGDRLTVTIADAGCGFDMRYADRMFEPFQRLHGPDQGGGDGLGLAIARAIVERHDGRIWAESSDDGARVHLELPTGTGSGSVRTQQDLAA
ncbi:sensor histidine kinase [Luteimonas abyssi]|uniref:sensor histidine kinase n=1 Tax=Luteimonas abyssi TaxID=1247514 RepID=UPI000AD9BF36|nr:ATP-binding protein [Luteimonas abyssi]